MIEDALTENDFGLIQRCLLNLPFESAMFDSIFNKWASQVNKNETELLICRFILLLVKKKNDSQAN